MRDIKRRRHGRRSVFTTLLVSYVCILLFPLGVGAVVFMNIEREMIANNNRTNFAILEQISKELDSRFAEIDQTITRMMLNAKLQWYVGGRVNVNNQTERTERYLEIIKEMSNYVGQSKLIDDYFIYFRKERTVVSPMMKTDLATFTDSFFRYDSAAWDELTAAVSFKSYLPAATVTSGAQQRQMLAVLQSMPLGERDHTASLVVLVDEQDILNMLPIYQHAGQGDFYILDDRDVVLVQSEAASAGQDVLRSLTSGSKRESAPFEYRGENGNPLIVSYKKSEVNNWTYVSVVQKDIFMARIYAWKQGAVLCLFVYLVLGITICYWLSRRQYRPVRELVGVIYGDDVRNDRLIRNEFEFIRDTLATSLKEERKLKQELTLQAPVVRANFVARLIRGFVDDSLISDQTLQYFGIHLPHGYFATVLVEIEEHSLFLNGNSERDWSLARFMIMNIGQDLLAAHCGYVVELDRNRIGLLLNVREDEMSIVKQQADRLLAFAAERLRLITTAGISDIHPAIEGIAACYREANTALAYKLNVGPGMAIAYTETKTMIRSGYTFQIETEVQLINYVKSGEENQVEKLLDDLLQENTQNGGMTPEMCRCLYYDLCGTLFKIAAAVPAAHEQLFAKNPFSLVVEAASIEEMHGSMKRLFRQVCGQISFGRRDHADVLYRQITEYIGRHYRDWALSSGSIAQHTGITPQYLSTFFKKMSGETITDYLTRIRIAHARRLLIDDREPMAIVQIAREVGYTSDVGFTRAFKKLEGVTPGKYREIARDK